MALTKSSIPQRGGVMPVRHLALVLLVLVPWGATCYSLKECVAHGLGGEHIKVLCYKVGLLKLPSSWPSWLPNMVTNLDASQNQISSLQQSNFQNLSHLQVLNISQNKINTIENCTFSNQGRLVLLNLTDNRLTILSDTMFSGLVNLTTLLLSHNNISTIEKAAFAELHKLTMINLTSNKLQTLDSMHAVFELRTLVQVHISDNGLRHFLTEDLSLTLMNLTELDFSRNPLSGINVTSNILQNLQSLDSSFVGRGHSVKWFLKDPCFLKALKSLFLNGINMKPPELSNLIQNLSCSFLEIIHLTNLNLTDSDNLVEQICSFQPNLSILQLQGNNFTGLKEDVFKNCRALSHLDLSMNHFKQVSKLTFRHLNMLQVLSLANNQLMTVSDGILHLPSLRRLDLSSNKIEDIFLNHSVTSSCLTHLNLGSNKLIEIGSSSQFQALGNLLELQLEINRILDISEPFPPSLIKLVDLEIRKNKLTSIRKHTFINLSALKTLNLAANQIESIELGAFDGLSHLETLLLCSNNIASPLLEKNIFSGLVSLKNLQLFSNGISYDSSKPIANPPFLHLKSLQKLAINSQHHLGLRHLPANFFEGLVAVQIIHTGNLAVNNLDPVIFHYTPNLKELDISNNPLASINQAVLEAVPNLTELHIQQIGLKSLDAVVKANLSQLMLLRATGNQLQSIKLLLPKALPSLLFLDIGENPFTCSCDNQDFLNWSIHDRKTQVLHFYTYTCAYPEGYMGKLLYKFDDSSCTVNLEFILFTCTSAGTILLMACCTFYHLCRWHVAYAYYFLLASLYDRKHKRKNRSKYTYDAFVSYNRHNEEWVINDLLPTLEEQYQWKMCLHHRDFEPGKPILDNIVENIYASRKTICVISRYYLESEWCSSEMQVASFRLFDERKDVLVLIFLEEIPSNRLSPYHRMRKLVKKKTYLSWPKKQEEIPRFWQKVNMALKTRSNGGEDNPILRGTIPDEE